MFISSHKKTILFKLLLNLIIISKINIIKHFNDSHQSVFSLKKVLFSNQIKISFFKSIIFIYNNSKFKNILRLLQV